MIMWDGIIATGKSDLAFIETTNNRPNYVKVLTEYILLYESAVHDDILCLCKILLINTA